MIGDAKKVASPRFGNAEASDWLCLRLVRVLVSELALNCALLFCFPPSHPYFIIQFSISLYYFVCYVLALCGGLVFSRESVGKESTSILTVHSSLTLSLPTLVYNKYDDV